METLKKIEAFIERNPVVKAIDTLLGIFFSNLFGFGISVVVGLMVMDAFGAERFEPVLECTTTDGKQLSVSRDTHADLFLLGIGTSITVKASSNDMGTSYRYSAAEPVSNREIYMIGDNRDMFTIGVTDKGGGNVSVYYERTIKETLTVSGSCDKNKIKLNRFGEFELFQNMINVDNE